MIRVHFYSKEIGEDDLWQLMFPSENFLETVRKVRQVGGYKPVAEIDTDNSEYAYKILQNGVVSESWTLDPPEGVTPLVAPILHNGREYGHRSAMIGDLFEHDGAFFVVGRLGFQLVA